MVMKNMGAAVSELAGGLFEKTAWPGVDEESWRRTDLSRILPKGFLERYSKGRKPHPKELESQSPSGFERLGKLPDHCVAEVITRNGFPVLINLSPEAQSKGLELRWVENGQLPSSLEGLGLRELNEMPDRFVSWHWRDMHGSLFIRVPASIRLMGVILIREYVPHGGQTAYMPHLHVEADQGAEISVVWSFESSGKLELRQEESMASPVKKEMDLNRLSDKLSSLLVVVPASEQSMLNSSLTVIAEANAKVEVTLRQMLDPGAVCFMWNRLEAARDSRINVVESQLGAAVVKTRSRAVMGAEGSEIRLKGLYVVDGDKHSDIGTLQHHRAPRAVSDALYKGVIAKGGRSVYQGLIDVAKNAPKTDAYLTNKNLILDDGARADSLPQLNILTDDVKCSHGSTTGRLDAGKLFYLQSRGFSPQEARAELIQAFMREVIDFVPNIAARILGEDLDAALEQLNRHGE